MKEESSLAKLHLLLCICWVFLERYDFFLDNNTAFPTTFLTKKYFKQMINQEHKKYFTKHGMFGIVDYLSPGKLSRHQEDFWVV